MRHRAMITPINHLCTRLIHITPSYWTIYYSLEIILKMGTVHWIGLQIQCSVQIYCFKNIQSDMNYKFKVLNCIGQLGL